MYQFSFLLKYGLLSVDSVTCKFTLIFFTFSIKGDSDVNI